MSPPGPAAARDASARKLLNLWFTALEAAEAEERRAKLAFDLSKLEVQETQALIAVSAESEAVFA